MSPPSSPDARHRRLAGEIRRAAFIAKQGLEVWVEGEPSPRHAALARTICAMLVILTKGLAAWNGDGAVVPGDTRTQRHAGKRPPHD